MLRRINILSTVPSKKRSPPKTDLLAGVDPKNVLEYVLQMIECFAEVNEIATRRGIKYKPLIMKAVRRFDLEFPSNYSVPEDLLTTEAGSLSYDQARALYKRLARYFALKGAETLPKKDRVARSTKGANSRWGKKV